MALTFYRTLFFSFIIGVGALHAADTPSESPADDQENLKKLSEAFGHFIGRNLKNPGIDFDLELVIKGMRNGAAGQEPPIPDDEYEKLMGTFQAKAYFEMADMNLKATTAFFEENAKLAGVVELEPGMLHYQILEKGEGETVKEGDTPLIHFKGTFLDGETFGSSEQVGGPVPLPLDQTIPGFKKGIVGMHEGEKRKIFVHPDLGFGTSGNFPPNTTIIFEVKVEKANAPLPEEGKEQPVADEGNVDIDFPPDGEGNIELPQW